MEKFKMWDNIPGTYTDEPDIEYYKAEDKKGDGAVIIFPGGGYVARAEHEGKGYAQYLNSIGLDAFVVQYRVNPHKFPLPLVDARRSVRWVRHNADKFGINPNKIAVMGSSAGGTDFLTMSIKALHPHFSIGLITIIIDLFIILMGWPVFGNVDAVLYGLTSTILTSLVIDKIMYGLDAGSLMIIISVHSHDIATGIGKLVGRGSTKIHAFGSYTGQRRDVLLCACSKSQTYLVCRMIQETDPNAFVMITETTNIYGEGFSGHFLQ